MTRWPMPMLVVISILLVACNLLPGRTYVVTPAAGVEVTEDQVGRAAIMLGTRLAVLEIESEARIDGDRIAVSVPASAKEDVVLQALSRPGVLEFIAVPEQSFGQIDHGVPLPEGMADVDPLFDGTEIAAARIGQDPTTAEIVVDLELSETGARLFDEHAEAHFGEQFAIVLDDIVQSAPTINATRFGGRAQISGGADGFTPEEARGLVSVLKSGGSLPYSVEVSGHDP